MRFKSPLLLITTVVALVIFSPSAEGQTSKLIRSDFDVGPGQRVCSSFSFSSAREATITGGVAAAGGANNDIRILIVRDQKSLIYDSGRQQSVRLDVPVNEPGTYSICFDNKFSLLSRKTVRADITLVDRRALGKQQDVATGLGAGLGALSALADIMSGKPADEALRSGLNTAQSIFSDLNWARLSGHQRKLRNWRVVDINGLSSQADLEIVFVEDGAELEKWCRDFLPSVFGRRPHPAWGCTRPGAPWRALVWWRFNDERGSVRTLAHEIWHTKGYWDHVTLNDGGTWPSRRGTKETAPLRVPRPED